VEAGVTERFTYDALFIPLFPESDDDEQDSTKETSMNQPSPKKPFTNEAARSIAMRDAGIRTPVVSRAQVAAVMAAAAAPTTTTTPVSLPADLAASRAALCAALGLTADSSKEEIEAYVDALLDATAAKTPQEIAATARKFGLKEREVAMCLSTGTNIAKYAALKRSRAVTP